MSKGCLIKKARDIVCLILASAFGLGLLPVAPGSFGALLGVGMHLAVVRWIAQESQWFALMACFIAVCCFHFWLTPWAQRYWKESDPGNFVLDEVAGYLIVPLLVHTGPLWTTAVLGFLVFRIFDIIKLPGARYIDRNWHGAWGILLDDIVSGLYAAGLVWIVVQWCT